MVELRSRAQARDFGWIVGVAALYFAAAKFGLSLAFATKQVTAVWPPTGVAFVALLLLGYRVAPGVLLGAFLANATAGETVVTAAGIAAGNTLAGLVGVYFTRTVAGFDGRFRTLRDVLALVLLGAAGACIVSASGGVANLALAGIVPWHAYWSVWWMWWLGDAMGVLLIAPFLLAWLLEPRLRLSSVRNTELLLFFLALGLTCHVAVSGQVLTAANLFRLYAVFPFVICAAVRYGQREAASSGLLISGFSIWGAIHERGPFATGPIDQRLMMLDVFMAVVSVTALTLSTVVAERRRAEGELEAARDQLELRVQKRTLELAQINVELGKKNEEVEAFVYIVSHDLRGPLVNLQGFSAELAQSCKELQERVGAASLPSSVETAIRTIVGEDIPGSLRFIHASAAKFQRLIDALLALSRYGRQPYVADEVDVQALVETTIDSLQQSISKSDTKVSLGSLPRAKGDATAIGQVFSNLLINALNYLQPGRAGLIEIVGGVEGEMAHYSVTDNGSGIPAAAKHRIFQVFQRFHPDRAQGEGMGLAIVKRVVERHGGLISAESEEGVGTTFRFTLPVAHSRRNEHG